MIVLMIMTMLMLAIAERAADGQVGSGIGRPIIQPPSPPIIIFTRMGQVWRCSVLTRRRTTMSLTEVKFANAVTTSGSVRFLPAV